MDSEAPRVSPCDPMTKWPFSSLLPRRLLRRPWLAKLSRRSRFTTGATRLKPPSGSIGKYYRPVRWLECAVRTLSD